MLPRLGNWTGSSFQCHHTLLTRCQSLLISATWSWVLSRCSGIYLAAFSPWRLSVSWSLSWAFYNWASKAQARRDDLHKSVEEIWHNTDHLILISPQGMQTWASGQNPTALQGVSGWRACSHLAESVGSFLPSVRGCSASSWSLFVCLQPQSLPGTLIFELSHSDIVVIGALSTRWLLPTLCLEWRSVLK